MASAYTRGGGEMILEIVGITALGIGAIWVLVGMALSFDKLVNENEREREG